MEVLVQISVINQPLQWIHIFTFIRYLIRQFANIFFDVSSALEYFEEGPRGHCNTGQNGTSHLGISIVFQNQHKR